MRERRERTRPVDLLLNSVDRLGRTVDARVLAVAQEIARRAVSHGERQLGDPALALSLFEEAAATVSRTLNEKAASGKPGIRDIRGYLFRTYLRRLSAEKRAHLALDEATEGERRKWAQETDESNIERRILLRELIESCDTLTREILYLRLEGCSSKEIEKRCGIPVNAANLRVSKALRRLQKAIRARGHLI